MISNQLFVVLLVASVALAAPMPAGSSSSGSRRSSVSGASSRTSMSTHNQAQHQQQVAHQVNVVNAVQNQAWQPPAQQNPVNMQPLHVANPPAPAHRRTCTGCTILKRSPAGSSSSGSRRASVSGASSRTSMSTHNQAQHQQQVAHQVNVVNAVQNQAWQPPAQQNPVNMQPLHVANPPAPARRRTCTGCTILKRSPAGSSSSGSRRASVSGASSRTSMSTHNQAQQQAQQQQQAAHQVHVVNAVQNQAWQPPAQQNPVNMQPLHVANPPAPARRRTCIGVIGCTVQKRQAKELEERDFDELEARDFEGVEARGLDELD